MRRAAPVFLAALAFASCAGEADEDPRADPAPTTSTAAATSTEATVGTTTEPPPTTTEATTGTTEPPPAPPPKPKGAARWSAEAIEPYAVSARDVYILARQVCASVSVRQLAREYDAELSTAAAAASAFAQTSYTPPLRPAAEAGCLAGLRPR